MKQIYHVYNRGVEKRNIFFDENDYCRFAHDLFEFNDVKNSKYTYRSFKKNQIEDDNQLGGVGNPHIEEGEGKRELLVNIIAFCLMPNHFHLLLMPMKDDGITLFMKKIGGGYANYFNDKYNRSGVLFQGRYKKVLVENSNHFEYLGFYIHCNPLDLRFPEWRKGKVENGREAFSYLENYKWSSFPSYLGHNNYQSVTQRELLQHSDGPLGYREYFQNWLNNFNDYRDLINSKNLNLE
jgi:putative transposase